MIPPFFAKEQLQHWSIEKRFQDFSALFEFPPEDGLRLEQFAPHAGVL